jgi:hypothetical protein
VGTLNLRVPQDREGTFSRRLFSRYQRNEKALVLALMQMYLEGASTRKVKHITEELCGTSFSKSLVSSLAGHLDSKRLSARPHSAKGQPRREAGAQGQGPLRGSRLPNRNVRCYKVYLFAAASVAPPIGPGTRPVTSIPNPTAAARREPI